MERKSVVAIVTVVAILLISAGLVAAVTLSKNKTNKNNNQSNVENTSTPTASTSGTVSTSGTPTSTEANIPADSVTAHKVVLSTEKGDITLDLYPEDAPLAVRNFVTLGKKGYYNNVIFHRVIQDFMIQAGDPTGTGTGGESIYGPTFKTEINSRLFAKGTLGAARTSAMDTNGSQFFIMTQGAYPSLDGQYTVFGQADEASMAVVQAIGAMPVDSNDKPLTDVKITGFKIVSE